MPYTEEEKIEIQKNMYGMSEARVLEYLTPQAELAGKEMLLMGMLSDAQHMIDIGQSENARQLINRVKLALHELPETDRDRRLKELQNA